MARLDPAGRVAFAARQLDLARRPCRACRRRGSRSNCESPSTSVECAAVVRSPSVSARRQLRIGRPRAAAVDDQPVAARRTARTPASRRSRRRPAARSAAARRRGSAACPRWRSADTPSAAPGAAGACARRSPSTTASIASPAIGPPPCQLDSAAVAVRDAEQRRDQPADRHLDARPACPSAARRRPRCSATSSISASSCPAGDRPTVPPSPNSDAVERARQPRLAERAPRIAAGDQQPRRDHAAPCGDPRRAGRRACRRCARDAARRAPACGAPSSDRRGRSTTGSAAHARPRPGCAAPTGRAATPDRTPCRHARRASARVSASAIGAACARGRDGRQVAQPAEAVEMIGERARDSRACAGRAASIARRSPRKASVPSSSARPRADIAGERIVGDGDQLQRIAPAQPQRRGAACATPAAGTARTVCSASDSPLSPPTRTSRLPSSIPSAPSASVAIDRRRRRSRPRSAADIVGVAVRPAAGTSRCRRPARRRPPRCTRRAVVDIDAAVDLEVDRRARSCRSSCGSRRSSCSWLSMKLCPPKPGLTLITSTRSTMSIR